MADADGQFNVVTPVGRFRVTAVVPAVQTDAGLVSSVERSLEVNVVAGKISEVTFHLPVPVVTLPPSGIKGLVLFGPISPVTLEGQPNEAPAANATVVVEQIVSTATVTGAVQFRWTGITGKEGRFEVRTPVGRFRVTSTLPSNPTTVVGATATIRPPSATVEVTAESGKVSETTLHIDTGLR